MKQITITKVVSRNFVLDFWSSVQNLIGENLTSYEKMADKAIEQIKQEIQQKTVELIWFRYETTQLTNGSLMVLLYGEEK